MNRYLVSILSFVIILSASTQAVAAIYRYVDEEGREFYVTDLDFIPEQYRSQAGLIAEDKPVSDPRAQKPSAKVQSSKTEEALDQRIKQRMLKRRQKEKLKNIEIYVTSWCPHCANLERFLKSRRIPYKRYDIERDKAAKKRHAEMNPSGGIPVIKIGDHIIRGNNQRAILNYLNK